MSTTNPMKNHCLFGDICPCGDCEECSDYTPVDVYGEPDVNLSRLKRIALEDWVQLMKEAYCD